MKNILTYLVFVIVLLYSCGGTVKKVEQGGGVKFNFSGVGERSLSIINNRLTSVFPSVQTQLNNGNLQIEISELVGSESIKKMIEGNGIVQLKPTVGNALILNQEKITDVKLNPSPATGMSQIMIAMNSIGAKEWSEMTKQNVNNPITILVDGEKISAPIVKTQITSGITSVVGKNEAETKMLFSLIKFPSTSRNSVSIMERKVFIKNHNNEISELPQDAIEQYERISKAISKNRESILSFINQMDQLKSNVKTMLQNDIKRMADNELEIYLSETKLNTKQFQDVLNNAEKLIESYENGTN